MADLTLAKRTLPSAFLKTCCKSEFITPLAPYLIPVSLLRLQKRWAKKAMRHGGCPETSYLLQSTFGNYCQVFQGRGKEGDVGCLCWNVPSLQCTKKCWYLAGGGTEELCTCPHVPSAPRAASPLMAESWRQQVPLILFLWERPAVVSEKCLLASSCVLTGVLQYPP